MTLIEIMIVVALIALLTTTLIFGSGMFTGANRRAAATLIVVGVRKGLAHANTTGNPVRLSINMDSRHVMLEESSSREVLRKSDDEEKEEQEDRDAAAELLESAEAAAEQILSGASGGGDEFSPVLALGQEGDLPGRQIGKGIALVKVQTEHDEEPVTDGQAYIYFWPGGMTERAIVQIARIGDEDGVTVVISPLTGRAVIKRGFVDLPEDVLSDDEEFSEREEP